MTDAFVLRVKLRGEPVGTLTSVGGDQVHFAFSRKYVADGARPTLGLAFKDRYGSLIADFAVTRERLMPFFSNLLPEGHLRDYLARRAGVKAQGEFHLLGALGRDLPGAVTVEPAGGDDWPPVPAAAPEGRPNALRFSLAGVQLKFSAVRDGTGFAIPPSGAGGSWIVKLPSRQYPGLPENEFAMLSLARLVGIHVPEFRLVDVEEIGNLPDVIGDLDGQALTVRRFDRTPDGPIHMEDFAQVFDVRPEAKYEKAAFRHIAHVLGVEAGMADVQEFVRRLTFCTLTGNADMHLKNWSLVYHDRRTPALSPAYDLVSTIPYVKDDEAALKFSRTKRFDGYTTDELCHLAAKARIPEIPALRTAKETAERFREAWANEKRNLPQRGHVTERIDTHLATLRM